MAGRPRGVDDAVILKAAAEVIGRIGPAKLTLAAVADEVGLVPGTLVQRFGSKRGLLLALAARSARSAETLYERARGRHDSPLSALRALAAESMADVSTPQTYANHLAFLCMDLTDPEFHEHALALHRARGEAIGRVLADAVAAGELADGTDTAAVTASIQTAIAGAGLTWALDREGALAERVGREIDAVLAPHLPQESEHRPQGSEHGATSTGR